MERLRPADCTLYRCCCSDYYVASATCVLRVAFRDGLRACRCITCRIAFPLRALRDLWSGTPAAMHPCSYPWCQRSFPFRMNVGRHMCFHHASGVGRPPSPSASSSPSSPPPVPELLTPPGAPPSRENTPPHDLFLGPGVDDLLELDEDLFLRDDDLDNDYGSEARSSDVGDATDLGEVEELFNFEDEDEPAKLLSGIAGDTLWGQVLKHSAEL